MCPARRLARDVHETEAFDDAEGIDVSERVLPALIDPAEELNRSVRELVRRRNGPSAALHATPSTSIPPA
jgi:hypothetical protein